MCFVVFPLLFSVSILGSQFDVDGGVIHGPACKNLLKPEMQW